MPSSGTSLRPPRSKGEGCRVEVRLREDGLTLRQEGGLRLGWPDQRDGNNPASHSGLFANHLIRRLTFAD